MKVLIVGAGAVGQVYGWHLQRGGATVGVVIRPRQRDEAAAGFVHYPLNEGRDPKVIRRVWRGYVAVETPEQVAAAAPWDQVWLCVSATALAHPSMRPLIEAAGPDTTVVLLTPGPDDLGWLSSFVGPARIVTGTIPFISWHAPLPGEALEPPGTMYWHPPMSASPFDGVRAMQVAQALSAGGARAAVRADQLAIAARGTGLLACTIGGLQAAGWRFADFRRSDCPELAARAAREAVTVGAAMRGLDPGPMRWAARPWIMRLATRLAPALMPFDIETYLQVHFTKVGDQQRASVDAWIRWAAEHGYPHDAMVALRARMGQPAS